MFKNKSENAITLIALVVSIIVLLILAGVSIAVLTGENGIINRASSAKTTNEESEIMENIRLAYNNAQIGKYAEKNENFANIMKSDLEKVYGTGDNNVKVDDNGDNTYTVTIRGRKYNVAANGNVTRKNGVTAGKFQTKNNKAYYYTGSTPESGTEITAENIGDYLGRKVSYTPASTFSDRGKSSTYRIFYIDIATEKHPSGNYYGDGLGTIYLKADDDGNNKTLNSIDTTNKTDVNVMSTLNPMWNATYSTSGYDNAKYTKYLLDKGIWNGYKDTAGIANYVVGAPSLEMWVDSYNAFLAKNPVSGKYAHNCTVTQDTTNGPTGANNGYGYYIGYNNAYADNSGWYTAEYTLVNPDSYSSTDLKDRVCAWNKGSGYYYWLASPSADGSSNVMLVSGVDGRVGRSTYRQRCVLPASFL